MTGRAKLSVCTQIRAASGAAAAAATSEDVCRRPLYRVTFDQRRIDHAIIAELLRGRGWVPLCTRELFSSSSSSSSSSWPSRGQVCTFRCARWWLLVLRITK